MIDVIDLKKTFGDLEVLKGINVTINKGDIVVVIGVRLRKKYIFKMLKLYGRSDLRQHHF